MAFAFASETATIIRVPRWRDGGCVRFFFFFLKWRRDLAAKNG
jgi:hypothetical protein